MKQICVIIPAYNEEKNLGAVIEKIKAQGFFALVVDDGSTDATVLAAQKSGAVVLESKVNQGKGSAIRRGVEYFLAGDFKAAVFIDSDGQHKPEDLPNFIEKADKEYCDVIVGNRLSDPVGMPWIRRITNTLMSRMISHKCCQDIADTQCGFRYFSRKALQVMRLHSDNFEIETEMLLEACKNKFKIHSMSIQCVYHPSAQSKIRPVLDTIRFFKFLAKYK